jgi:hypothetical protein
MPGLQAFVGRNDQFRSAGWVTDQAKGYRYEPTHPVTCAPGRISRSTCASGRMQQATPRLPMPAWSICTAPAPAWAAPR